MPIYLILCITIIFFVFFMFPTFYDKFGWFKEYYHNILHWHEPDESPKWSDGCSIHCKCKYCGKEILQDSQGNWFEL